MSFNGSIRELILGSPIGRDLCKEIAQSFDFATDVYEVQDEVRDALVRNAVRFSAGGSTPNDAVSAFEIDAAAEWLEPLAETVWNRHWSSRPQLHKQVSGITPTVKPIVDMPHTYGKPMGAIWTCPARLDGTTDWDVVVALGAVPERKDTTNVELKFTGNENVYRINTPNDWLALVDAHPGGSVEDGYQNPNWTSLAEQYDGIHLTTFGLLTTQGNLTLGRHKTMLSYWDVESCAWFRNVWAI